MTNNTAKILESDFRQFQSLNKKQHDTWKDFISNIARMDANDEFKEVAATGYIEGQSRKISEEMSKMLVKSYEKSYDINYDFYVDKLGLTPKNGTISKVLPESDRLFNSLLGYEGRLSREINELLAESGRGQISGETFRNQLISALNQNEDSLNRFFQNELRYLNDLSSLDSMNDVGVMRYVFVAVMDGSTSETCSELNGKIFLTKDAEIGVNAPPMHPNCRSVIIPFDEVDYEQNKDDLSYEQWLKDYSKEYFDIDYIVNDSSDGSPWLKQLSDADLYKAYIKEIEALDRLKVQYDTQGLQYEDWMKRPGQAASELTARGIDLATGKGYAYVADSLVSEFLRLSNIDTEIERLRKKGYGEDELSVWKEILTKGLQPLGNTVVGGTKALDGNFYDLEHKSDDNAFEDIVSIALAISSLLTAWKTGNINLTPKEMETIQKAEDAVKEIFEGDKLPVQGVDNLGKLDETSKAFSSLGKDEQRIVTQLLNEGKNVKLIPETPNAGKMYDFMVDGVPTELKTLNGNNINTLVTKVGDALKQIDGSGKIIYDISKAGFTSEQMAEINARLVGKYGEQVLEIINFVK